MYFNLPIARSWKDVFQAIANRNQYPEYFHRIFIGGIHTESTAVKRKHRILKKIDSKINNINYYLGDRFPNVYLTMREADCMALMLKHYSNREIAVQLNLSVRTIEFYIKNMRQKINCYSKMHLMQTVLGTEFVKYLDEIFLSITTNNP